MKQTILISGMHCPKCSERVMRVFSEKKGVENCEIVLEEGKVILTVACPLPQELLQETVEDLGFDFVCAE